MSGLSIYLSLVNIDEECEPFTVADRLDRAAPAAKKHTSHKLLYLKVMFFFQIISKFQRIIIFFAYFSFHPPNTSPLPARSTAPLFVSLSLHLFCWKKKPKTNKINSGCFFFSHISQEPARPLWRWLDVIRSAKWIRKIVKPMWWVSTGDFTPVRRTSFEQWYK